MSTVITIEGETFLFNGVPTDRGRSFQGKPVEGLLINTRMVQAIFDDENGESAKQWVYPDTGRWEADRNVEEVIAALSTYKQHGILAVTLNLQGGMPITGTERVQPWVNSAFTPQGELKPAYMARLEKVLRACDAHGMGVILGHFYFGQHENIAGEAAIVRGVDKITDWLLDTGLRNVMVEVNNECDVPLYKSPILTPVRVHELIARVKSKTRDGRRLLVSASITNWSFRAKAGIPMAQAVIDPAAVDHDFMKKLGAMPIDTVLDASDFILFHTNGLNAEQTEKVIGVIQASNTFKRRPRPVCINEDSIAVENMDAAFLHYVPWGYYDQGKSNYRDGFQSPPVNWGLSTPEKQRFFRRVGEITGARV